MVAIEFQFLPLSMASIEFQYTTFAMAASEFPFIPLPWLPWKLSYSIYHQYFRFTTLPKEFKFMLFAMVGMEFQPQIFSKFDSLDFNFVHTLHKRFILHLVLFQTL